MESKDFGYMARLKNNNLEKILIVLGGIVAILWLLWAIFAAFTAVN